MIIYVTKYALTKGIIEVEGEIHPSDVNKPRERQFAITATSQTVTAVNGISLEVTDDVFGPGQWFYNREQAETKARTMRDEQLAKLHKKINKLNALNY